jgi:Flp pilus assembly protein TadD
MRMFIFVTLVAGSAFASTLDEGLHALTAGDWPRAERMLSVAAHEQPNDFNARFNHAAALRELGRNDEAVGEYRAALELARTEPQKSNTLYGIALARDAQGDPTGWNEYLSYAGKYKSEQPSVQIARERLEAQPPGTRKAAR